MQRVLYGEEHEFFRDTVRAFFQKEVVPHHDAWEDEGTVPRSLFTAAGAAGILGMQVPAELGGGGVDDFRFNAIVGEEACALGVASAGLSLTLHNDICLPYFLDATTREQRQRWLPGIASGELITAVAMTEPGTGSDLAGIATTAVRDGGHYVVNGAKTFITNGINSDLVITAVRTDPESRHGGLTLLVVEDGMDGFSRGRNLDKVGLKAQDTAELHFDDVHVPVDNRLGEEGEGFALLTANLAQERLSIAVAGIATARAAIDWAVEYTTERSAFGQRIADFQNTKFELAECDTDVAVTQSFIDRCIQDLNAGTLTAADAARAKLHATELQNRVVDRCLQLFGGYGYMREYPIARAWADARITRIYGGTSEIMKTIIAKDLGL